MPGKYRLFAGTAHPALAAAVAAELGVPLGPARVDRFPDGELWLELETSVRARSVYLIQPTGPPVDEHLVELLAWLDALRRAGAGPVTVVAPYFGYARQDRRTARGPIVARLAASLIERAGAAALMAVDLHTPQVEGFFDLPVEALTARGVLLAALRPRLAPDVVVVSPDAGFVRSAAHFAAALAAPLAVIHKARTGPRATEVIGLAGEVRGRSALVVDDMIATGSTLRRAVEVLVAAGVRPEVTVAATHGVFAPGAERELTHPAIRAVLVTDSLPPPARPIPHLERVPLAGLLAEAIRRHARGASLRDLAAR